MSVGRLSHGVGVVEEEDRDLLVWIGSDVHAAMHAVGRLVPVRVPGHEVELEPLAPITVFDREGAATQNHRHAVKRIAMPGHRLTGRQKHAPHERRPAPEENVFCDNGRLCFTLPALDDIGVGPIVFGLATTRVPANTYRGGGHDVDWAGFVMGREGGMAGLTLGGAIVIAGIVIAIFWSVLVGVIVALIGLLAFGGFARGRWY